LLFLICFVCGRRQTEKQHQKSDNKKFKTKTSGKSLQKSGWVAAAASGIYQKNTKTKRETLEKLLTLEHVSSETLKQ